MIYELLHLSSCVKRCALGLWATLLLACTLGLVTAASASSAGSSADEGGALSARHRGQRAGPRQRRSRDPRHPGALAQGLPLHDLLVADRQAPAGEGPELRRSSLQLGAGRPCPHADGCAAHSRAAHDRLDACMGGRGREGRQGPEAASRPAGLRVRGGRPVQRHPPRCWWGDAPQGRSLGGVERAQPADAPAAAVDGGRQEAAGRSPLLFRQVLGTGVAGDLSRHPERDLRRRARGR